MRALVLGFVILAGCAGAHSSTRVGDVEIRTFRRAYANAHVIERGGVRVMVDSGYGEEAPALDAQLREAGIDPSKLAAIIVTHAHADHAGGASWFHDKYGTKIVAGAADRETFAGGHNDPAGFCPQGSLGKQRLSKDRAGTFKPIVADVWIDGPTSLQPIVGIDAQVLPLSSHTPGSLAVIVGGAALVGDLFRGSVLGHSATVHFFMCDLAKNRADIHTLLGATPAPQQFFPGHFGPLDRASVVAEFGER
jgi:hydroxyacylglutathione hydrolase